MILKYILSLVLGAFGPAALADEAVPCGPPGAYVTLGESVEQLVAECGEASSMQQYDQPGPNVGEKVKWYYVANALEDTDQGSMNGVTLGARFEVDFIDGKVDLIYSNASSSGPYESYGFCGKASPNARQQVKRGDTMEVVRNRCGDPSFTKVESSGVPQAPVRVIVYTYTFDPTVPSTIVTVSNNVVTDVKLE